MRWPARGSLVWRLYALGLVQLVLLAGAVLLVGVLLHANGVGPPSTPHEPPARSHEFGSPPRKPFEPPRGPGGPLTTFFVSGILIVGVGAVLTWRWMARPLAQLSRATQAFGGGDLAARVSLTRNDELGELGTRFNEMAERIQTLVLVQKELLANVSHELRTPIARIRVALDIADEAEPSAIKPSLADIALDLAELEGLVDDILTSARMQLREGAHQGAALPLHIHPTTPHAITVSAAKRFNTRYPGRRLVTDLSPSLPEINVDALLFRRAVDNLLDNAHKYTPGSAAAVELEVRAQNDRVVFEVRDQGMGISPEDLPRVFEPFFRAERSRSRELGGIGLGLTLARRIVEAHGGRLELSAVEPRGTRARIELPSA